MSQKPAGAYKPRDPMTLQSVLAYEVDHGPILVPKPSGFSFNAQGYYERWANRNPYSQRKTVKGPEWVRICPWCGWKRTNQNSHNWPKHNPKGCVRDGVAKAKGEGEG